MPHATRPCPPPAATHALHMQEATEHLNRWTSGQFLDPLYSGDWSLERLSALPPDVLPRFTPEQSAALRAAKVGPGGCR